MLGAVAGTAVRGNSKTSPKVRVAAGAVLGAAVGAAVSAGVGYLVALNEGEMGNRLHFAYRDTRNSSSCFMADAFPLWGVLTLAFSITSVVAICTLFSACMNLCEITSCSSRLTIMVHKLQSDRYVRARAAIGADRYGSY